MSEPVGFEDRLSIATPEGVEVELTLANIGSRFIAGVIDLLIEIALLIALAVLLRAAGSVGAAIYASISFAVIFFYDVLFEVLGGGKTPGKRWTGLRVVRAGGRPITFVRSSLRNILRIIDILPAFYAIGMTAIFVSRRQPAARRHGGRRARRPRPSTATAQAAPRPRRTRRSIPGRRRPGTSAPCPPPTSRPCARSSNGATRSSRPRGRRSPPSSPRGCVRAWAAPASRPTMAKRDRTPQIVDFCR